MKKTPKVFIMSGPSGAGKSSITRFVSEKLNIPLMISATTREKRPGEVDGVDYFFLTKEEFEKRIKEDGFLEYEKVHNDQYYGTPKDQVKAGLEKNGAVILEIDTKGTMQLLDKNKEKHEFDFVLVFCKTRSIEELKKRILGRSEMDHEILEKRMNRVKMELEQEPKYNYTIINDDFDDSCEKFVEIIKENL